MLPLGVRGMTSFISNKYILWNFNALSALIVEFCLVWAEKFLYFCVTETLKVYRCEKNESLRLSVKRARSVVRLAF